MALVLAAGLTPAVAAVLLAAAGARAAFAWAMGGALESRAREAAEHLDRLTERKMAELAVAVRNHAGDPQDLIRAAGDAGGVEAVILYRSPADHRVEPVGLARAAPPPDLSSALPYLEARLRSGRLRPGVPVEDTLPDPRTPGQGWLTAAFPHPPGMAVFLIRAESMIQAVRSSLVNPNDEIALFSLKGYPLHLASPVPGLETGARAALLAEETGPAGYFGARDEKAAPGAWTLAGYALSRRQARLGGEGLAGPPWAALTLYDMENFLGPQARLVWAASVAAGAWTLLLMALAAGAARRVAGPVKALRRQAESMAAGDLDVRARVDTRDELQDLAEAFNAMTARLREQRDRILGFNQELERRIEERTRELESANQKLLQTEKHAATGRLAANLAHEINNPLGIIKNYLRLVADALRNSGGGRRATDPKVEHLDIMNEELDRIARIVRQLLDLHRPADPGARPCDAAALAEETLALMEESLRDDGIEIVRAYDPALPPVLASPDLLRQVILNLIRNAQDAMKGGGRLSVRAEAVPEPSAPGGPPWIRLTVSDSGPGIPKEIQDRIFDPFFTTKPPEEGTGLGLSVSYGVVRSCGGTIEVRDAPAGGTSMVVTLPPAPAGCGPDEAE